MLKTALHFIKVFLLNACALGGLALFAISVGKLSQGSGLPRSAAPLLVSEGDEQTRPPDPVAEPAVEELEDKPPAPPPPPRHNPRPKPGDRRPVVVLDAGHGGKDGGTVAGDSLEKSLNLDAARRVAKLLEAKGIRVVYTRADDSFISLAGRAEIANRFPGALFVSIHHNASTNATPSGVETYYAGAKPNSVRAAQRMRLKLVGDETFIDDRGRLLALKVQEAFCASTGAADRGIKDRPLAMTRWVSCPAVLIECGFLSNPTERKKLRSDSYRRKMSEGIAAGVLAFLNAAKADPLYGVTLPDREESSGLAENQPPEPGS